LFVRLYTIYIIIILYIIYVDFGPLSRKLSEVYKNFLSRSNISPKTPLYPSKSPFVLNSGPHFIPINCDCRVTDGSGGSIIAVFGEKYAKIAECSTG